MPEPWEGLDFENLLEAINQRLAGDSKRNERLVEQIRQGTEQSILFFTNSVAHAEEMSARPNLAGISAAAVSGNTPTVARRYFLPDSASITVSEAGEKWIATCAAAGLERTTLDQYRQHLNIHIVPHIGRVKLSQLSAPVVREFEDRLRKGNPLVDDETAEPRSQAMVKRVRVSLGAILADAQERGLVARKVVRELRAKRRRGGERHAEQRQKGKLKIGIDIPFPTEIKAIIEAIDAGSPPLILTAIFTGLRASELRGLRWPDVDLVKGELHVRQRADRYQKIWRPKTASGERVVPLTPKLVAVLREWKMACPKGALGLVFPNTEGKVGWHSNIINRVWIPIQIAAGVYTIVKDADGKVAHDKDGKPVRKAKYTGLHALRHFYASWCINREKNGGARVAGEGGAGAAWAFFHHRDARHLRSLIPAG